MNMTKDEIKSKLRNLAECGGDDALLPQTLLELIEAGEVSAVSISKVQGEIVASEKKSTQQIAAIIESLVSIQKTQQSAFISLERKSSWSIYLVSAILVVVLVAGGFCAWIFF